MADSRARIEARHRAKLDALVVVLALPGLALTALGGTFVVPDELSGRLVGRIPRPGA